MKIIITEAQYRSLITEAEVLPYKVSDRNTDHIRAFFTASGLKYNAHIWHDDSKHDFGTYEVAFDVEGQKHAAERQGKGIKHLNSVLYTVMDFVDNMVKKHKIQKIKIDGANDEKDDTGFLGLDTARGRIYTRFLKRRYPNDAINAYGRLITVDMTKVFSQIKSDQTKDSDKLIKLLVQISDENPNEEEIRRGLGGHGEDMFGVSTDAIENSKLGGIYFEIDANKAWNEYTLGYELFDKGEQSTKHFDSFEDMYSFIKNEFLGKETNELKTTLEALKSIGGSKLTPEHYSENNWQVSGNLNLPDGMLHLVAYKDDNEYVLEYGYDLDDEMTVSSYNEKINEKTFVSFDDFIHFIKTFN